MTYTLESCEYHPTPITHREETVVLLHGAASHSGQWRLLIDQLRSQYHVITFNQFGYRGSPHWPRDRPMTFADQAAPIIDALHAIRGPLHIVGHSHGGSIAALVTLALTERVASLSMYEPNAFGILDTHDATSKQLSVIRQQFGDLDHKRAHVELHPQFAEELLDFWLGVGAWRQLSSRLRAQLIEAMAPTIGEVYAALNSVVDLRGLERLASRALLMYDPNTPPLARAVSERLCALLPHCRVATFVDRGHLAPVMYPELINASIIEHIEMQRSE